MDIENKKTMPPCPWCIEVTSPFDPNVLRLTCPYCLARFQAEAKQ